MNVYALKGHKVKVTVASAKNGSASHQEAVKNHLKIDEEYTVKETMVNNSYASVLLNEIKSITFSSVSFVDIDQQSKEADMMHPDWNTWETEEGYQAYLDDN